MEMSHCLEHSCPSRDYCFRYNKEEDPNKIYHNFGDGLELTKCPEFIDIEFDEFDVMFMMEICHENSKGVKEKSYARRYGEFKKV